MQDIKEREMKMQERREKTDSRDFVKEIASLCPLVFYKNNEHISKYPPNTGRDLNLVSSKNYLESTDNNIQYGADYDFSINFWQNYQKVYQNTPLPHCIQIGGENVDYTEDTARGAKNVYLTFCTFFDVENVLYSFHVKSHCRNILNSIMVRDGCDNIYNSVGVLKSYNIFYSRYVYNCSDIRFSSNLTGCKDCISCDGLENQSYYIENKAYPKDEYLQRKKEILSQKDSFPKRYFSVSREGKNNLSKNVTGSYIINSENIQDGQYIYQVQGGRNILLVGAASGDDQEIYDCFVAGSPYAHNFYGVFNAGGSDNVYFSETIQGGHNIYYSNYIIDCSYCLGCVGLRNKSFCILNKEYSKEDWFVLADRIFAQMDADGTLGTVFPGWMNPFYFNDTAAYLIDDSFTKEEVTKQGYLRRDEEIKVDISSDAEVVYSTPDLPAGRQAPSKIKEGGSSSILEGAGGSKKNLDDFQGFSESGEWKINPEILKKVIKDEKGNYYKIVPMELDFLQKHGLPLPELHWLDRIKLGFKFK